MVPWRNVIVDYILRDLYFISIRVMIVILNRNRFDGAPQSSGIHYSVALCAYPSELKPVSDTSSCLSLLHYDVASYVVVGAVKQRSLSFINLKVQL